MILNINNATFYYGDELIFDGLSLDINDGDRVGLVGGNGSGKTTLLRCIVGQLQLFSGTVTRGSGVSIGYLAQNGELTSDNTVYDELLGVFGYEHKLTEELSVLADKMSSSVHDSNYTKVVNRYNFVLGEIDRTDAYNVSVKVDTVINGMGIGFLKNSIINTLSGGERTKVELCKLLLTQPSLLILDEPTNHLDLDTLEWLQNFLATVRSSMLIVSHDRQFLDFSTNKIVELYGDKAYSYKGNYTKYVSLRDDRLALESKEFARQQEQIAKLTDYVARNKARASTAKMAQSRQNQLDKMDILDDPIVNTRPPRFVFSCSDQPTEKVVTVTNLAVNFDGRQVLDNISTTLLRGDRIAVVGANGTGKSPLLRYIVGLGLDHPGTVVFGKNVRMGYYDQQSHVVDDSMSVLDQLWSDNSLLSQTEIRSMLAMVNLTGEEVYKSVGSLSGGERARLVLCMLMAKDNNLLILDEPTNHLDLLAREQLEQALLSYNGTLLFVSHDRYFVNKLATRTIGVDSGTLCEVMGNYDSYTAYRAQLQAQTIASTPVTKSTTGYRNSKQRSADAKIKNDIAKLEKQLDALDALTAQLNGEISDPSIASNYQLLMDKCSQLDKVHSDSEQVLLELEQLMVQLDS